MFTIVLVGFGVVVLALLSIYCLCCVAARDQRRAAALTADAHGGCRCRLTAP